MRHFWHEIRWCFAVSSEFRKRCLAVGFSPWRLVDGTAGAAAAQEQSSSSSQEQQQRRNSKSSSSSSRSSLRPSLLWCFPVRDDSTSSGSCTLQLPPSFTAMVFPCPGPSSFCSVGTARAAAVAISSTIAPVYRHFLRMYSTSTGILLGFSRIYSLRIL